MTLPMALIAALAPAPARVWVPPLQPTAHYAVREGDTLYDIARRYFVRPNTWPVVQRVNHIADPWHMPAGMMLVVPRKLLRFELVGAKVVAFRGAVTLSGTPTRIGTPVREGMTISTGANASITVECADGSRFTLPSQTAIGVTRLRRTLLTGDIDRAFAITRGRTEWQAAPATTPDSRFIVRTPVSVSAVRGTEFRVGFDGTSGTGVVDGTVGVGTGRRADEIPVPKGFGVVASRAGVGQIVPLLPAPALVAPDTIQSGVQLTFTVVPVAGAAGYAFEIAPDAAFVDRVASARVTGPVARFDGLPDRRYFARVTAIGANGLDGLPTVFQFERMLVTMDVAQVDLTDYLFKWAAGGTAPATSHLVVSASETLADPIIDRADLVGFEYRAEKLQPGTYWWRVAVTREIDGKPRTATGDIQSFRIVRR